MSVSPDKQVLFSIPIGDVFLDVIGRKRTPRGYVALCIHDHPNSDAQGYIMEHRVVMESFLGRFLTKKELVHHENEIKHDNRILNLTIINQSEHTKLHHLGAKRSKETRLKMSEAAKKKYKNKKDHPNYIDIDDELKRLYESGEKPIDIQKKLKISRGTYYNKIKYLEMEIRK